MKKMLLVLSFAFAALLAGQGNSQPPDAAENLVGNGELAADQSPFPAYWSNDGRHSHSRQIHGHDCRQNTGQHPSSGNFESAFFQSFC